MGGADGTRRLRQCLPRLEPSGPANLRAEQPQGVRGSSSRSRCLLRPRRARQHRKAAVRRPRPEPRAATDTPWARSRRGPRSEKVMPVAAAPTSVDTAPKGKMQRCQELPAPPVASAKVCRGPAGPRAGAGVAGVGAGGSPASEAGAHVGVLMVPGAGSSERAG
ncbi:translation initiation factor IF-2-like [Monodelphis domestica]|uniref:translation initiation factor IF-2-like n=1 Tax=Monodelphis domestica TaxID=13616 RepID=UPI0024E251D9|nr:translation initiation factor IF-2-like [Monodelphis domestica]